MNEFEIILTRIRDTGHKTLGVLAVYRDGDEILTLCTIEPSWLLNVKSVSCIPTGEYRAVERTSARFGRHIHIINVPGRSHILIHAGNTFKHTEGCILPGTRFAYVDEDEHLDVSNSVNALAEILRVIPENSEFPIIIQNDPEFQTEYWTTKALKNHA